MPEFSEDQGLPQARSQDDTYIDQRVLRNDGNIFGAVYGNVTIVYSNAPAIEPLENSTNSSAIEPNPYRGLQSFREQDAAYFFGRQQQSIELWELLKALHENPSASRFLPVYGPSGSGKSSLVRAGLLPLINQRSVASGKHTRVVILEPRTQPLQELAIVLARMATGDPSPDAKTQTFLERLNSPNSKGQFDGLKEISQQLLDTAQSPLIVIVDQFEEIYSQCNDKTQQRIFIDTLLTASVDKSCLVMVVVTLRSDFLGETQAHNQLNRIFSKQGYLVPAMNEAELRQAICEPADKAGYSLDTATVNLLIQEAQKRDGALPLLQVALSDIWKGLHEGKDPAQTLEDIGGVGGALARKAEAIFQALTIDQQTIARRIFLGVIQLGEGTRDTRRRTPVDSLIAQKTTVAQVSQVIEQFAWREARLLTLASDNDGRKTVEVTHEALIEHWQRLHEWLGESREDIRFQRRLEEAAQYWDGNGRPAGSLWRRPNLDILENYKHRANQDMTPLQLDFSKASFAANQRRKVLIGAGIGTLVGFAGLTSLFAVNSQRSERKAIARQLAVKSEQIGTNNSDESRIISALLAVEASRTYTNENAAMIEVDQALRNSLKLIAEKNQNPERNDSESATRRNCETSSYKIMAANSGFIAAVNSENSRSDFVCIWSISISDRWHIVPINRFEFTSGRISALDVNGMAIAIASDDSTIQLWHADRAEKTTHFEHGSSVNSVAFSPDGNYIATAGDDNIVRLWDIESEKIVTHFEHGSSVNSVAFSPDGKHIATIINDNLVQLWDVNRKEKITRFKHEGGVNSVAFSPDGDQIFVGDGKSVKIWNLHRDEEPVSLDIQYEFDSMDFISEYMIFGGTRNGIRIWDLDSEREMFRIPFNDNGFFLSLGDSDREKNEGVIQLPITKGCNEPNFFSNKDYGDINIRGYYQPLISPDDRRILTYENGTLKIWDTENCENITQVNLRRHLELEKNLYIDELIFSPNSEFIAILVSNENSNNSEEHKILVWDTIQGVKKLKLSYEQEIRSIRFSPDGKSIGFTDLDNELVQILSIDGGNEIARFAHENIRRLVFSPDGKKAATDGWDDVVRIWDLESHREVAQLNHERSVGSLVFSPDSKLIATLVRIDGDDFEPGWPGEETARLWKVQNGERVAYLTDTNSISDVSFSPDSKTVATVGETVRIWDTQNGKEISQFTPQESSSSVVFSKDGKSIAIAGGPIYGGTKMAIVWDVNSEKEISNIFYEGKIHDVRFSANNESILTVGRGETDYSNMRVHLSKRWRADLASEICYRVSRNLTSARVSARKNVPKYGM